MAAKIVAPKSAGYEPSRALRAKKLADLKALKGKQNRSAADRDAIIDGLVDLLTNP